MITGSLSFLIGALDQMQLMIHLPVLDISLPSNALNFFKVLVPIVNFDVMSEIDQYNNLLNQFSSSRILEFEEEEILNISD